YFYTTSPAAALNGQANAIDTRAVRVNGTLASWNAVAATWNISGVPLLPGLNRVLIQAFGANATEIARTNLDIWYDRGTFASISGEIAADTVWSPGGGPYLVTAALEVNPGITLRILPGTTVFIAP